MCCYRRNGYAIVLICIPVNKNRIIITCEIIRIMCVFYIFNRWQLRETSRTLRQLPVPWLARLATRDYIGYGEVTELSHHGGQLVRVRIHLPITGTLKTKQMLVYRHVLTVAGLAPPTCQFNFTQLYLFSFLVSAIRFFRFQLPHLALCFVPLMFI